MLVCKESSHFNIRLEYVDHEYQSYRTITDFIKRFINQAILNTFSIIDNLVCKKLFSFNYNII